MNNKWRDKKTKSQLHFKEFNQTKPNKVTFHVFNYNYYQWSYKVTIYLLNFICHQWFYKVTIQILSFDIHLLYYWTCKVTIQKHCLIYYIVELARLSFKYFISFIITMMNKDTRLPFVWTILSFDIQIVSLSYNKFYLFFYLKNLLNKILSK